MPDTDRKKIKDQQKGYFVTAAGILAASDEVNKIHTRTHAHFLLSGGSTTTNVAEKAFGFVKRRSQFKAGSWAPTGALTANATNYGILRVFKRTSAGASKTLVASWNTATGAQGTTVALADNALAATSTPADLTVAAGSVLTYEIEKFGAGGLTIGEMALAVDLEEI